MFKHKALPYVFRTVRASPETSSERAKSGGHVGFIFWNGQRVGMEPKEWTDSIDNLGAQVAHHNLRKHDVPHNLFPIENQKQGVEFNVSPMFVCFFLDIWKEILCESVSSLA